MTGTTLERRLAAARPEADAGEQRLEAMVASRLFGPQHEPPPRVGRFTLLERIGRGGMGDVYAAYDPVLDRKVALKLLRSDAAEPGRLLAEARAVARLAHPGVVAVLEVGALDDAGIYLVMEFIAGVTLRAWLQRRPPLAAVLHVFQGAGGGLAAAHDAGLVHRDVKPENILVSGDDPAPRARVVDFGLAVLHAAHDPQLRAGTPAYMAPEQLQGRPLDPRADQFSLCVALHEALTGRHPFAAEQPGTTPDDLLARIHAGPVAGERPLPAWLRPIVHRGLAPAPADRHPSMHALLRELAASPARRRRRALVSAALGLALASSALTALGLDNLTPDPCAAVDAGLTDLWDPTTRDAARLALTTSGLPDADELWHHLAPRVDDATAAWQLARHQTCRARQRSGPDDDALRLRELCLLRHRASLAGLTNLLREPTRDALLAATTALAELPPLAACDDPESLRRELATPGVGAELVPREAILHQLLALRPRAQAGLAGPLLPQIERWTALTAARDPGLHAHALHLRGLAEETLGQHDAAAASLTRALHEAIAARHDRLHAELAVRLVWIHGVQRRDATTAATWTEHADAALRAIGDDPILGPRLLDHRGAIASLHHDHAAAERLHRAAIERGATRPAVDQAMSTSNLGLALLARGDFTGAEPNIRDALATYRAVYGPRHPTVAAVLSNLGNAHVAAGRSEPGISLLREALALKERSLGRDHLALLSTLNSLGNAHSEQGRGVEARAHYLRALAIGERQLGPDSPRLESLIHNLAFEAWQLGDHAELIRHSTRALTLQRRLYGDDNPITALTLELLARGQLGAGRPDEAAATIEQALAQLRKGPLAPGQRGAVLLSVAWIRHQTGAAPALVRPLADEAERLLRPPPGPSPQQQHELQALQGPP